MTLTVAPAVRVYDVSFAHVCPRSCQSHSLTSTLPNGVNHFPAMETEAGRKVGD